MSRALLLVALAFTACRTTPTPAEPDAAPPASASARKGVSDFPEDPEDRPVAKLGPAPSASALSREAREKAVLDLLAGKLPAHDVEDVATDPGKFFDVKLHRRLARPRPKVKMDIGPPTEKGLDATAVRRAVQQEEASIKACYRRGLGFNPTLQGRAGVRLTLDAEGRVANVEDAGSDIPDGAVLSCIRDSLRPLVLPKPAGLPATVTVPIRLSPE